MIKMLEAIGVISITLSVTWALAVIGHSFALCVQLMLGAPLTSNIVGQVLLISPFPLVCGVLAYIYSQRLEVISGD